MTYRTIYNVLDETISHLEKCIQNPESYLQLFDSSLLTFSKGELIILAGCHSIGKTSFLINCLHEFGITRKISSALVCCNTTDAVEIRNRILSQETGISFIKLRNGFLTANDIELLEQRIPEIANSPIYISDTPNISLNDLESAAIKMLEEKNIEILLIDQLEYLAEICNSDSVDTTVAVLSKLKNLALKLNIPIVLSMQIENNKKGMEPDLHSFRQNMIIPHIADKVLLLHRTFNSQKKYFSSAKLSLAKNESGITGEIALKFYPSTVLFKPY